MRQSYKDWKFLLAQYKRGGIKCAPAATAVAECCIGHARISKDRIHELGGWEGSKDASSVYDHGLTSEQLEEVQEVVWQAFSDAGYLEISSGDWETDASSARS